MALTSAEEEWLEKVREKVRYIEAAIDNFGVVSTHLGGNTNIHELWLIKLTEIEKLLRQEVIYLRKEIEVLETKAAISATPLPTYRDLFPPRPRDSL